MEKNDGTIWLKANLFTDSSRILKIDYDTRDTIPLYLLNGDTLATAGLFGRNNPGNYKRTWLYLGDGTLDEFITHVQPESCYIAIEYYLRITSASNCILMLATIDKETLLPVQIQFIRFKCTFFEFDVKQFKKENIVSRSFIYYNPQRSSRYYQKKFKNYNMEKY